MSHRPGLWRLVRNWIQSLDCPLDGDAWLETLDLDTMHACVYANLVRAADIPGRASLAELQ